MSGHEHEHHHDHEHDHEHHHDHEGPIEITTHEEALIGTVRIRIPGSYEAALEDLKTRMAQTADEVEAAVGMVGGPLEKSLFSVSGPLMLTCSCGIFETGRFALSVARSSRRI